MQTPSKYSKWACKVCVDMSPWQYKVMIYLNEWYLLSVQPSRSSPAPKKSSFTKESSRHKWSWMFLTMSWTKPASRQNIYRAGLEQKTSWQYFQTQTQNLSVASLDRNCWWPLPSFNFLPSPSRSQPSQSLLYFSHRLKFSTMQETHLFSKKFNDTS